MSEVDYIWIGGTGRCGTNLMKELLNKSGETYSYPFEIRFLVDPDGIIDYYSSVKNLWNPQISDVKLKRLEELLYSLSKKGGYIYPDWELEEHIDNFNKLNHDLIRNLTEHDFMGKWCRVAEETSLCRTKESIFETRKVLGEYLKDIFYRDKQIYVDDGTYNLFYAHLIKKLLPNSKFIYMKRNPIQTILSMADQDWCPDQWRETQKWYFDSKKRIEYSLNCVHEDVIGIQLEELVENPKYIMDKVCDFISIEEIKESYINEIVDSDKMHIREIDSEI